MDFENNETPEEAASEVTGEPLPVESRRRMSVWLLLVALLVGSGIGFGGGVLLGEDRVDYAAEQFCALGEGSGASLLDISGWVKAAQRTNDDWDAVLSEISTRCESWRLQVAGRAGDL